MKAIPTANCNSERIPKSKIPVSRDHQIRLINENINPYANK